MARRPRVLTAKRSRVLKPAILVAAAALAAVVPVLAAPPAGPAAVPFTPGVFMLVTVGKADWWPYDYGSAFFFDGRGDAYTASHVVSDVVRDPALMLAAIVDGVGYAAHVRCWNPASPDHPGAFNRDVAIVHVGPEVPLFPLKGHPPARRPLAAVPLRVRPSPFPATGERVRVIGFGRHDGRPIVQREEVGRVTGVSRNADRTAFVTAVFPANAAPANGDSGGPMLDSAGDVIGLAAWLERKPPASRTAVLAGVAAASFRCVAPAPPDQNKFDPAVTPVRLP